MEHLEDDVPFHFWGDDFSFHVNFLGSHSPSPHHSFGEKGKLKTACAPSKKCPRAPHLSWICLVGDFFRDLTTGFIIIQPPFGRILCLRFFFPKHLIQIKKWQRSIIQTAYLHQKGMCIFVGSSQIPQLHCGIWGAKELRGAKEPQNRHLNFSRGCLQGSDDLEGLEVDQKIVDFQVPRLSGWWDGWLLNS